jgi:lysophospholipase L1-like esterase
MATKEKKTCSLTWKCCGISLFVTFVVTMLILVIVWYAGICPAVVKGDEGYADEFRAKAVAAAGGASGVLLVGDSNLDYWDDPKYCGSGPSCSGTVFPGSVNIGVAGSTCASLAVFAEEISDDAGTDRIVMHCGANDIQFSECGFYSFKGVDPDAAFASLENAYIAMLGSRSNATAATAATAMARRVLYIGTFRDPWSGEHDFYPVLEEYDFLVKSWALSLAGDDPTVPPPVVFLDMASSLETVGNPRSFYSKDKIHFSPEGYEQLSEWVTAALSDTMESDCVVWIADDCSVYREDI